MVNFGQQILIGPKYLPNILSQIDIDEFPSYIQRFRALSGKEILQHRSMGWLSQRKR